MELTPKLIEEFKEIHKDYPDFAKYSEDQIKEIANGVANYYLTLFKIYMRIKKEEDGLGPPPDG